MARRARLQYVFTEDYELDQFRELLGVPKGKLKLFGNLNKQAIQPAVAEINGLSSYGVKVMPIKTGRRVTGLRVGWWLEEAHELHEVEAELRRHSACRRARLEGTVETALG